MRKTAAKPKGTTAKHAGGAKHKKPAPKHHPVVVKNPGHGVTTGSGGPAPIKPIKHIKKRTLSIGSVSCCSAEAFAASLRLIGHHVTERDVLDLYFRTAFGPEDGATILDTYRAASVYGLAGMFPYWIGPADGSDLAVVGLELPGPHAVLATPEGWHTWGEVQQPTEWPEAVIEEAWAIRWR